MQRGAGIESAVEKCRRYWISTWQ